MLLRTRIIMLSVLSLIISIYMIISIVVYNTKKITNDLEYEFFASIASVFEGSLNSIFAEQLANRIHLLSVYKNNLKEMAYRNLRFLQHIEQSKLSLKDQNSIKEMFQTEDLKKYALSTEHNDEAIYLELVNIEDFKESKNNRYGLSLSSINGKKETLNSALNILPITGDFQLFKITTQNLGEQYLLTFFLPLTNTNYGSKYFLMSSLLLKDIAEYFKKNKYEVSYILQESLFALPHYKESSIIIVDENNHILANNGILPQIAISDILQAISANKQRTENAAKIKKVLGSRLLGDLAHKTETHWYDSNSATVPLANGDSLFCVSEYIELYDWYVIATVPTSQLHERSNYLLKNLIDTSIILIITFIVAVVIFAIGMLRPLTLLTNNIKNIDTQNFSSTESFKGLEEAISRDVEIQAKDEIGDLARAFINMSRALSESMHTLVETSVAKNRMEGELTAAASIQTGMLPLTTDVEKQHNFPIASMLCPAREVGGDLYDVFALDDGRSAIIIGDVSDKGVPAALFMAMTLTLARSVLDSGLDPSQAMTRINSALELHNPSGMFVTLFLAVFDPNTGDLQYSNGGHCPPIIINRNANIPLRILDEISGPLVGALPDVEYELKRTHLTSDETCLIFTDGVTEAMNAEQQLYGDERLQALVKANCQASPQDLIRIITESLNKHRGLAPQSDDITILSFRPRDNIS